MSQCSKHRAEFSAYIDGALSGQVMQQIGSHLESCAECRTEFEGWRAMQQALVSLGPAKAPADLALRLRIAISSEATKTPKHALSLFRVRWQNSIQPFLLQASAGFASAVLLIGTVALLIGMFATPEPLAARDEPIGMESGPHFLYSSVEATTRAIGGRDNPVVVQVYVDGKGRVYDYRIVSGANDANTRSELDNLLLFSVFDPARSFGQPVRGIALLSFSGVSVQG